MKYILPVVIAVTVLAACHKKDDAIPPCPYVDILYIQSYRVIAVIDKDSNNLLFNGMVDSTDVVIKDANGSLLKGAPFLDSTHSKVRYITLPLTNRSGVNTMSVTVKNQSNTLAYKLTINRDPCGDSYVYDNFKFNGTAYTFMYRPDYFMSNYNNQWFKVYAPIAPLYIMLR